MLSDRSKLICFPNVGLFNARLPAADVNADQSDIGFFADDPDLRDLLFSVVYADAAAEEAAEADARRLAKRQCGANHRRYRWNDRVAESRR